MTRDITDLALSANELYPFFAIELMFSTSPLYLWTGLGELTIGGITYTGTGSLLNISEVKETADIAAAGAVLTLSGIPTDVLSLALQEPYQGRLCYIKFGMLTTVDNPTSLTDLFVGYMDQMNISEEADTSTLALGVESKLIDLERPRVQRYTSASQKSRYANDLAFDFIPDLQDRPLSWGRKA
tara:strand:- start:402 stop:953 length:552 start_codon:yes stop_codon:yes gene_type:complete